MAEYDAIAREYAASKQLPFRAHVEAYTLFELLGDLQGKSVIDLACGDGIFTRQIKQAGASEITGVDLSASMIELAEANERERPLGCQYVCADAADFKPQKTVDVVVAAYLLNYAQSFTQLLQFCQVAHDALVADGVLIGMNDNVRNVSEGPKALEKYGMTRTWTEPLAEGDVIRYTMYVPGEPPFGFDNFYLKPAAFAEAFEQAGFRTFRWVDVLLNPSEANDPYWNEFMASPPITAFIAER